MEKENIINKRVADFSKNIDIIQTILIFLISLLVPTFLGELITKAFGANSVIGANSQIIIGTIVNIALVTAAINLKGWNIKENSILERQLTSTRKRSFLQAP